MIQTEIYGYGENRNAMTFMREKPRKNGTIYMYALWECDDGQYVFNIDFCHNDCYAPIQLCFNKKEDVPSRKELVKRARKQYKETTWGEQPYWND